MDRGVLSWESTISGVLPDMAGDARPEYRAITLLQLLTHTSGLPENVRDEQALNSLFYDESSASLSERRRAYIARALQDEPEGRAGRFSYSNTGFLIAAFMAETASKRTYESLMRDEVFAPLGMTSAGFRTPPIGQPAGHKDGKTAVPRDVNPDFFAPATVTSAAGDRRTTVAGLSLERVRRRKTAPKSRHCSRRPPSHCFEGVGPGTACHPPAVRP